MKNKTLLILVLSITSISFSAIAQSSKAKFKEYALKGEKLFAVENYSAAIQEYLKAAEIKPSDPYVDFSLAECYRHLYEFEESEKWYTKLVSTHSSVYPLAPLWLGLMQKSNGKYVEAEKTLSDFIKTFKPSTAEDKFHIDEAKLEYNGCVYALEEMKKPLREVGFKLLPSPVNTKNSEYSPTVFYNDSSIIVTSAKQGVASSTELPTDNFHFKKQGNDWVKVKGDDNFEVINSLKNNGAGEFTKDRNKFYFTICNPECAIYVSKAIEGKFAAPIKLNKNINLQGFWNAQPTLAPSADTMLFMSTRPDGKGQNDIWMSVNSDNTGANENWQPAINMDKFNTAFREMAPFWDDHTNKIYLSSDGHLGFGGLDFFAIRGEKRDSIINMGMPFNSSRDDFYISLGNTTGYLVSNRQGGIGKEDVYSFSVEATESILGQIKKNSFEKAKSVSSLGRIVYKNTQQPVANKSIYLKNEAGQVVKQAITNSNGEFRFENLPPDQAFKVTLNEGDPTIQAKIDLEEEKMPVEAATNVKTDSSTVNESAVPAEVNAASTTKPAKSAKASNKNSKKSAASANSSVNGDKSEIHIQEFKVKSSTRKPSRNLFDNVYFDFNSVTLNPSDCKVLDDMLVYYNLHKEIQIEIKAYSDGYGDPEYNKQLAEQRGKACFDYLVSKGADQTALLIIPVGEGKFVGSNNSFIGRQLNRRVEFSVIGGKDKYETQAMAYIIEPKMTLFTISQKFNMTLEELKALNGLTSDDVKAYSSIRVKRGKKDGIISTATLDALKAGKPEFKFHDMQFFPANQ